MSLSTDAILAALRDHAMTTGCFETVNGHEAKNAPGQGLTAEIFLGPFSLVPPRSGLATVSVRLEFTIRIRTNFLQDPADGIDTTMLNALDALMGSYANGFTLGGLITAVDLLGMSGGPVNGRAGYLNQDGQLDRIVEINLPLLVDDLWTEAA